MNFVRTIIVTYEVGRRDDTRADVMAFLMPFGTPRQLPSVETPQTKLPNLIQYLLFNVDTLVFHSPLRKCAGSTSRLLPTMLICN